MFKVIVENVLCFYSIKRKKLIAPCNLYYSAVLLISEESIQNSYFPSREIAFLLIENREKYCPLFPRLLCDLGQVAWHQGLMSFICLKENY